MKDEECYVDTLELKSCPHNYVFLSHCVECKFKILLEFVKNQAKKSCCNVCECNSCNAVKVLREIGEAE